MTNDPDDVLERAFEVIDPSAAQTARMERALEPAFSVPRTSLAMEWIELLRIRPLMHGTLTVATAAGVAVLSPLGLALAVLAQAAR